MSLFYQGIKRRKQFFYIVKMKTCGGFIKYKQNMTDAFSFTKKACQLYPLRLAAAERVAALAKFYISKANILQGLNSFGYVFFVFKKFNGLIYAHI